jgi:CubicO group peptidase (beta-lactamase class C family)
MNKKALDHSIKYIDSWIGFRFNRDLIPGMVVAVSSEGRLIFNKAYGFADLERKTKLTSQHIFRIASHSKTFTATALMQLIEKDKLKLDDYAVDYIPWLTSHKDTRWKKVTIRQLMSHSAGVIRDGEDSDYWQYSRPFLNKNELKELVLQADLVVDNNVKLKYSNIGYSLLGLVIEIVSGMSYNDYVIKNIVKALELKNTGPEYLPEIVDRIVVGYSRPDIGLDHLPMDQIDTHAMSAATGFYSNSEDLCTFYNAQLIGSGKLISDESKKEMQRIQWHAEPFNSYYHEDYGLGIDISYVNERKLIGHGGGFPGHITSTAADPKNKLVVTVLTNYINTPVGTIRNSIHEIIDYFQTNTSTTPPKHDASKFEGRYMSMWSIADIVVTGDKIVCGYPNTWYNPLNEADEFEYVNDKTIKTTKTSSFSATDELVKFSFNEDKVESVNYHGSKMLPEKIWLSKVAKLKKFGLDSNI